MLKVVEKVEKEGLPMLDYQIQRQLVDDEGNQIIFNPYEYLIDGFNKAYKIVKFRSFKHFNLRDLLNSMRRKEISEQGNRT